MVAGCKVSTHLLQRVAQIYDWLDSQICKHSDLAGTCDACGKCCDFKGPAPASEQGFDHRLFVTTPEMIYLAASVGAKNVKAMTTNRCPYQTSGKCTIYKFRFAGCRIFYCKGDADFQSRLSEMALKKFKLICTEFQIAYRYADLASALNSFTAV